MLKIDNLFCIYISQYHRVKMLLLNELHVRECENIFYVPSCVNQM